MGYNLAQLASGKALAPYFDKGLSQKIYDEVSPITETSVPNKAVDDVIAKSMATPLTKNKTAPADDRSLFRKAIDVASVPEALVTNYLYNKTNPDSENDVSSWDLFKQGYDKNGIMEGLYNLGEKSKYAPDISNNLFGQQKDANANYDWDSFFKGQKGHLDLRDIAEFAGDVVADPLTYLTFGAGSVAKAGLKGAVQEGGKVLEELAKDTGQQVSRSVGKDVFKSVPDKVKQASLAAGKTEEDAVKAAKIAEQRVQNAAKTARKKAQNAIISLDVPFTRVTKQFGDVGKLPIVGKYLKSSPRTITRRGGEALIDHFNELKVPAQLQADIIGKYIEDAGHTVNGTTREALVDAAGKLSTDAYEDILSKIKNIPEKDVTPTLAQHLQNTLADQRYADSTQKAVSDALSKLPPDATAKDIEEALTQAKHADVSAFDKLPQDVANALVKVGALEKTGVTQDLYDAVRQALQTTDKDTVLKDLADRASQAGNEVARQEGVNLDRFMSSKVRDALGANSSLPKLVDEADFYVSRAYDNIPKGTPSVGLPPHDVVMMNHASKSPLHLEIYKALVGKDHQALVDAIKANPKKAAKALRDIIQDVKSGQMSTWDYGKEYQKIAGYQDLTLDSLKSIKNTPQALNDAMEVIAQGVKDGKGTLADLQNLARKNNIIERKRIRMLNKAYETAANKLKSLGDIEPVFSRDLQPAFDGVKWVDDIGRSPLGKWLSEGFLLKHFNPRTFGTKDDWINWLAKHITDADTKRYSNAKMIEGELGHIQKLSKDMSETEIRNVQYLIEKQFPESSLDDAARKELDDLSKSGKTAEEIEQESYHIKEESFIRTMNHDADAVRRMRNLSGSIESFLDKLGRKDLAVGVLSQIRKDYFPHTLKVTDEIVQELRRKYSGDHTLGELLDDAVRKSDTSLRSRRATMSSSQKRKTFQTFADLDNYLDEQYKIMNDAGADEEARAMATQKFNDISKLFERDTFQALAARAFQSVRARSMRELFDQFVADGVIRKTKPAEEYASDFVKLLPHEMRELGLHPSLGLESVLTSTNKAGETIEKLNNVSVYIHKDILHGLQQMNHIFTDKGFNNAVKNVNAIINIWKYGNTVLVPRHYINNFIGNIFNNQIVGVDIKSYRQSKGLLDKFSTDPNSLNKEEQKLIQQAFDHGIIGQGFTADFIRDNPFHRPDPNEWLLSKLQSMTDRLDKTAWVKTWRGFGERADDFTRLALYLDTLRKTGSIDIAASTVRKYLFNYHELTNTDKIIRAFGMPFWSWTKNNLPLQVMTLLEQPRYIKTIQQLRDRTFDDKEYPEYVKDGYIMVDGKPYPVTLPMQDLSILGEKAKFFASSVNPLLKAPFELTANKNMYTGSPIDIEAFKNRSNEISTEAYYKYLMKNSGIVGQTAYSIFPVGKDESRNMGDILATMLTGNPYEDKRQVNK
mgnify:FL=1